MMGMNHDNSDSYSFQKQNAKTTRDGMEKYPLHLYGRLEVKYSSSRKGEVLAYGPGFS